MALQKRGKINIKQVAVQNSYRKWQICMYFSQLTPVGTTIVRDMTATDKDADNWYITYEIDQNQSFAVSKIARFLKIGPNMNLIFQDSWKWALHVKKFILS